jgi:hypothetical protein
MTRRRFPPAGRSKNRNLLRHADHDGQALAYVYLRTFLKPLPRDLLPNAPLRDGSLVDQVFAGMSAKPVVYHVMRF